jgi:exoribonuclease-2
MNVFYEEDGGFKVARVMEDIGTSLQVEASSGKRSKIKANVVLLRFDSALTDLLPAAERLAADIDPQFLYDVCGPNEFGFDELALEYFGHKPSAAEAAACAIKLHAAPMYFYKRGKGRYQSAPEENLKAALASVERKKREAADMADWIETLLDGRMPEPMRAHLNQLLYKPDRNTLIAKACEQAVTQSGTSLPQLFFNAGAWPQHEGRPFMAQHDFHVGRFVAEHFPKGINPQVDQDADAARIALSSETLPLANVEAYSIDDAATTEIDDALSVTHIGNGVVEVGIHIAAPALVITPDSALDRHARSRLSTVYYPGNKITMLPDEVVAVSTLAEGAPRAVVSLYAKFDQETLSLVSTRSAVERVPIVQNLRLHELEAWLTADTLATPEVCTERQWGTQLLLLHRIATALKAARGAKDSVDYIDYNFDIAPDGSHVSIHQRARGSPVDTIVAEFMIFANSQWGKLLADNQVSGIYRVQQNMKTRMTTDALPHEGLGVAHYAWSSSPLRRYVDLINQRQLVALIQQQTPPYPRRAPFLNEIARQFDLTYDAYAEFQRDMERFWSLRLLEQSGETHFEGAIIRDELVRASALPMVVRLKANPAQPPRSNVRVRVEAIDYWNISGDFLVEVPPAPAPEVAEETKAE